MTVRTDLQTNVQTCAGYVCTPPKGERTEHTAAQHLRRTEKPSAVPTRLVLTLEDTSPEASSATRRLRLLLKRLWRVGGFRVVSIEPTTESFTTQVHNREHG